MLSRRANINIEYNNLSITKDIEDSLLNFTYEDYASGNADNISIGLHNISKKWLFDWAPEENSKLNCSINTINWNKENEDKSLYCGEFYIDKIDYSGRPLTCNIGALVLEVNNNFKEKPKSKTWKKATIKEIVQKIATDNNYELVFDTKDSLKIEYVEQSSISDLEFLNNICNKYGYSLKIFNKQLIVYKEEEYEKKVSIKTIKENSILSWSGSKSIANTAYDGCIVEYTDPLSGKNLAYTFKIGKGNKFYTINETVYSIAEAEIIAKAALRNINKQANVLSISIMGNTDIVSTSIVEIEGLGLFDGKYFVDKTVHSLPNYITSLELHKVLEGY